MAKAQREEKDKITPARIATEALQQSNNDVVRATHIMVARISKDQSLYRMLMDPLVKTACYDAIRKICRGNREAIWLMPQPSNTQEHENVIALARGTVATLFDFPLPGGLLLKDANRHDLSEAIKFYAAQAKDMGAKAKWLELIAQCLTDKKRVSDVLTEARLIELRDSCYE